MIVPFLLIFDLLSKNAAMLQLKHSSITELSLFDITNEGVPELLDTPPYMMICFVIRLSVTNNILLSQFFKSLLERGNLFFAVALLLALQCNYGFGSVGHKLLI